MDEFLIESLELAPIAKEILRGRGCTMRVTAHGSSMRPFICDGDILTIMPSNGSDIRVGDVAFHEQTSGSVVAHRVLARSGRDGKVFFETRGDAFAGVREAVEAGSVLGKAVSSERGKRVRSLDRGCYRVLALLWAACCPVGQVLLRIAQRLGKS